MIALNVALVIVIRRQSFLMYSRLLSESEKKQQNACEHAADLNACVTQNMFRRSIDQVGRSGPHAKMIQTLDNAVPGGTSGNGHRLLHCHLLHHYAGSCVQLLCKSIKRALCRVHLQSFSPSTFSRTISRHLSIRTSYGITRILLFLVSSYSGRHSTSHFSV